MRDMKRAVLLMMSLFTTFCLLTSVEHYKRKSSSRRSILQSEELSAQEKILQDHARIANLLDDLSVVLDQRDEVIQRRDETIANLTSDVRACKERNDELEEFHTLMDEVIMLLKTQKEKELQTLEDEIQNITMLIKRLSA